jgi:hypothetical protein
MIHICIHTSRRWQEILVSSRTSHDTDPYFPHCTASWCTQKAEYVGMPWLLYCTYNYVCHRVHMIPENLRMLLRSSAPFVGWITKSLPWLLSCLIVIMCSTMSALIPGYLDSRCVFMCTHVCILCGCWAAWLPSCVPPWPFHHECINTWLLGQQVCVHVVFLCITMPLCGCWAA